MKVRTNAPLSYDYGGTTYLYDTVQKRGTIRFRLRVVDVPEEYASYQIDRYLSGMYVADVDA